MQTFFLTGLKTKKEILNRLCQAVVFDLVVNLCFQTMSLFFTLFSSYWNLEEEITNPQIYDVTCVDKEPLDVTSTEKITS